MGLGGLGNVAVCVIRGFGLTCMSVDSERRAEMSVLDVYERNTITSSDDSTRKLAKLA